MTSVPNPIEPRCKALLLCDRTIVEEGTKKISLINIFSDFGSAEFPAESPPFTLFAQFTDASGRYEVKFEVHDLAEDTLAVAAGIRGNRRSPRRLQFADAVSGDSIDTSWGV